MISDIISLVFILPGAFMVFSAAVGTARFNSTLARVHAIAKPQTTGLVLMIMLKFMPLTRIGTGFALMWRGRAKGDESTGEISPFQALMTSLAATVGTGNIAGVATAIFLGGPGALFWMWCTALVGMATKYCEVVLAVHYREKDDRGEHVGGPMYAIKNGLGKKWVWLGTAFAIFGGLAGFGFRGRLVRIQSN